MHGDADTLPGGLLLGSYIRNRYNPGAWIETSVFWGSARNPPVPAQKNMTFITPYLPPTVSGEHGQLPQVFQNLLANSLKDCNEVEASRICLIAMRNGADRLLTVEDHSDLFQPELIFKPLKRLWAASEGLSFASTVYFPFRVGNK